MLLQVFELFDQLCMLSGGRCVFFGPADQALAYYDAAGLPCPPLRNPADHFLHAINPDFVVGAT
jgi:ABC-type multidrug transport system ATPase subunit